MPKAYYGLRRKSLKGNFLSLVTLAALLTISACTSAQSITDVEGPWRFKDQLYLPAHQNANSLDSTFTVDPATGRLKFVLRGVSLVAQPGVDSIRITNNGGTIISYSAGVATTWNLTTFHAYSSLNYNSTRIINYNINMDPLPDSVNLPHTYLNVGPGLTKEIVGDTVTISSAGGGSGSGISKVGSPAYGLTRTDDSTYIADTAVLTSQTRTTAGLAQKVFISDTAAMLLPYRNKINQNTDSLIAHNLRIGANTAAIALKENALGNPSVDGYILSKTIAGVPSWIAPAAGGTQTLQQTITAGATLTGANTVNNGGFLQKSTNGKNQFDSISINPSTFVTDSIWFDGTSITVGTGSSSNANRFSTLVSNKLGALESNHGVGGARMYVEGLNSAHIGIIPSYSATKYRWMVLDWVVNDMGLGVVDTATYAAAYLRYLDTAIARGWPANKILVMSACYTDSTFEAASTFARQTMFVTCVQSIAARRGCLYLNNYAIQIAKGRSILLSDDGIHPTDYGVSAVYVNPIVRKLGDSVRVQGQEVQVNGLAEFQRIKFKGVDTADYRALPIGIDSAGNVVKFDKNALINNSIISPQPQGASINVAGRIYAGLVATPSAAEVVQINGAMKSTYGRFTGGAPSGLAGASMEMGFIGDEGYIIGYNRTTTAGKKININPFGGQVVFGGQISAGVGITGTYGQFTGSVTATAGSGLELGVISGAAYLGGWNRAGGSALNMYINYLGGNVGVGIQTAPHTQLQTTSLALGYRTTNTSVTLNSADHTLEITTTGQTETLPTAVGITGRVYTIKLTASGSATVATTSSQTIDGATTYIGLSAQYKYVTVQSNGANWIVIANN